MDIKPPLIQNKPLLRRKLLAARQKISAEERLLMDQRICASLVQQASERGLHAIAGYHGVNGEPDISPALFQLHELGHALCLPVIHPQTAGEMQFRQWSPDITLRKNRFGIKEPCGTENVSIADIELVLTPLVGFSMDGHRIGMGGGYYDRIFSSIAEDDSTLRCGVAYSLQEIQINEPDPWDVPLQAIITEHGWFTFKR